MIYPAHGIDLDYENDSFSASEINPAVKSIQLVKMTPVQLGWFTQAAYVIDPF